MRLVSLHNPAIIGGGGAPPPAARAQVFDTFLRNSVATTIVGESPDFMQVGTNTWSVSSGAVTTQHDNSGVAVCADTVALGDPMYDLGVTGQKTVEAQFRCGTGGLTISVGVSPNTQDLTHSWLTLWSRSSGTATIHYRDASYVQKASTPHGGVGGVIQDVTCTNDGTTVSATWVRSGETSNVSYTITTENTYLDETQVSYWVRDAFNTTYTNGTWCNFFNAYETGGAEDTTLIVDNFHRSGDLDGDSPDISNGIGNTWVTRNGGGTPTTSLIFQGTATEGGYAYCNSTSTTCIATYDMGQANNEITANFVMPSVTGTRNVSLYPRYVDADNHWVIECNGANNELRLYYRKTASSTLKATQAFTSSNRDLSCTETKLDGGVITSTWAADGGTPATINYTISGEDTFTSSTEVGFSLRDSVAIGQTLCTAFKAEQL